MLNIIDLIIAGLALFYFLKNAGGAVKTLKNIAIVLLCLILLGILVRLLLDSTLISGSARKMLEESYFVKLSYSMIRWTYPTVESSAPKIDAFIKEKIISSPTSEVKVPKISIPTITIPDKELDKFLYPEKYKPTKRK